MSDSNDSSDDMLLGSIPFERATSLHLVNSLVEQSDYARFATGEFRKACELAADKEFEAAEEVLAIHTDWG